MENQNHANSDRNSSAGSDDGRENWNSSNKAGHVVRSKTSPRKKTAKRVDLLLATGAEAEDAFASGLLTPPTTQMLEATRTLISPPPEEMLRHASNIRAGSLTSGYREFTPSLLASNRPDTAQMAKRKRSGILTSTTAVNSTETFPQAITDFTSHFDNPIDSTIVSNGNVYTPNPKPRKQSKRHVRGASIQSADSPMHSPIATSFPTLHDSPSKPSTKSAFRRASKSPSKRVFFQSPHAANPEADYIPPVPSPTRKHLSARNRSSTPIIPYEPPAERFTPPREITLSPTGFVTPKARKSGKRSMSARLKSEPPEIDLNRPAQPPSPTDDPLLLSGRLRGSHQPLRSRITPSIASSCHDSQDEDDTPSFFARLSLGQHDNFSTDDTDMQLPMFDDLPAIPPSDGGWTESESDADEFNESGEYTGRFKVVTIPTKVDPPTSGTRDRMDAWGRPRSPFPYQQHLENSLPLASSDDDPIETAVANTTSPTEHSVDNVVEETPRGEDTIMCGSSPKHGLDTPLPTDQTRNNLTPDPTSPLPPAFPTDEVTSRFLGDESDPKDNEENHTTQQESCEESEDHYNVHHEFDDVQLVPLADEEAEEEYIDRQLSLEPALELHARDLLVTPKRVSDQGLHEEKGTRTEPMVDVEGDGSSSEEDASIEGDIVRITSADPRAAARAAAILKMHDYDCLAEDSFHHKRLARSSISSISRKTRRKTLFDAGIAKTSDTSDHLRRKTFGCGSPIITLPALLQEAECSLYQFSPSRPSQNDSFKTPDVSVSMSLKDATEIRDPSDRKWTKEDWKLLDACFTEERLSADIQLGGDGTKLAGVDEVNVEDVVDHFISMKGGEDAVEALGPLWTRNQLLKRARALQKKQRSGNVAPHTPTTSSRDISEVPDFTPLSQHFTVKPKLPSPLANNPFDSIALSHVKPPKPLVAPQYSHLLDQAREIEREVSTEVYSVEEMTTERPRTTSTMASAAVRQQQPTSSVGKRVKGLLFSYLPTLSKGPSTKGRKADTSAPGLPLPPREVFERQRKPIATPARPAASRPKHPKEIVNLHPAPPVPKTSIPRAVEPRRLVQLHPAPAVPSDTGIPRPRPRTSSGASVKDLVKCFENLDDRRKTGLHGTMSRKDGTAKARPTWKP